MLTEYVVTTVAVATMVLPVKGIVKDIAVGASTGAVDTNVVSAIPVHVDASRCRHRLNDISSSGYMSSRLKLWRHGPECKQPCLGHTGQGGHVFDLKAILEVDGGEVFV